MDKVLDLLVGIITGLFVTCVFMGVCLLCTYIASCWEWDQSSIYITLIGIVYLIIFDIYEHFNKIDIIIGLTVSFLILFFFCLGKEFIPFWCYIAINSITGINNIST